MPIVTLADALAVESPERERLRDADDAIRDIVSAVLEAARRDGIGHAKIARAMVGVLTAAAARQALTCYPEMSQVELGDSFADLAKESFRWATRRGVRPGPRRRGARAAGPSTAQGTT
jgi:hypothetical protein